MKQKFKKFGMLVAMLLAFLPASAYDFKVDGLYYEVVSLPDLTCKVVAGNKKYEKAEAVIPAEVTYNNQTFKVTEIGKKAFYNCSSLRLVTIPNSVTEIGEKAFSGCKSLRSVTIPDLVTEIGEMTFYGCSSLTSVTIPNSVTEIGERAFDACVELRSVTIPNSVTEIGMSAFYACSSLTSVTIPNSITEIRESVFHGCFSLTSVTIPNSVKYIGKSAFFGCSFTSITIPNSVTEIGERAFDSCSLTSVTIPNSVKYIDESAFIDCKGLTSVTIPNSVIEIGASAFYNCYSLTSVTIPNSVTEIGECAFENCSDLENITLSENITRIKYNMFAGCKSLSSLSIPGNVKEIEDFRGTFRDCESLKEVLFMFGESNLYAYWRDSLLEQFEKVFIDRELANIFLDQEYDFPMPNLKELTIGEHMTKLQIINIDECNQLENIVSYAMTPPTVSRFSNSQYQNVVVKVPTEALEAYQKDSVWGNFWNLQGFVISEVDDVEMDATKKTVVGRYDLNGRAVNEDYKGITIVRFSDGSTKKVVL